MKTNKQVTPNMFACGMRITEPTQIVLYSQPFVRFLVTIKRPEKQLKSKIGIDPLIWVNVPLSEWRILPTRILKICGFLKVTPKKQFEIIASKVEPACTDYYNSKGGYCFFNGRVTLRFKPVHFKNKKMHLEFLKVMALLPISSEYQKFSVTALRKMAISVATLNLQSQESIEINANIFQYLDKNNVKRSTWTLKKLVVLKTKQPFNSKKVAL